MTGIYEETQVLIEVARQPNLMHVINAASVAF
jgi:hypothetical protein